MNQKEPVSTHQLYQVAVVLHPIEPPQRFSDRNLWIGVIATDAEEAIAKIRTLYPANVARIVSIHSQGKIHIS